jgi:hypothetical protein
MNLDVVWDVERTFGIKLTDAEAERTRTVGQLYDLIELRRPNAGSRTLACLSQIPCAASQDTKTESPARPLFLPATRVPWRGSGGAGVMRGLIVHSDRAAAVELRCGGETPEASPQPVGLRPQFSIRAAGRCESQAATLAQRAALR